MSQRRHFPTAQRVILASKDRNGRDVPEPRERGTVVQQEGNSSMVKVCWDDHSVSYVCQEELRRLVRKPKVKR